MSFHIQLQPSDRRFEAVRDETLLSAALRQGIGLPYGCKDGACGSCKSRLLEGRVIHGAHQTKALTEAEEAAGWVLTCCAAPQTDCVLECRQVVALGDFPMLKMPVRVMGLQQVAPDVMVLRLQLPANQNFRYRPGQFIDFLLRDGDRRSYSMASAPTTEAGVMELHLRHMPGGKFTDHVFGAMKEKEILRVEGPQGSFFLRESSDKPIVFLASGTGFAPIKAILEHMAAEGITRSSTLYWGGRSRQDVYLWAWVEAFVAQHAWLRFEPILSEPKPEDAWSGRTGLVHRAVMQDHADLSGHEVYACGAPVMVEAARRDFAAQCGHPAEAFYADAFTSAADRA